MVELIPRELPDDVEFSAPHLQCYAGAQALLRILEVQTGWVQIHAEELGGTDDAMERVAAENALERQAIAEGVQVFCAMTVESALNLLGMMVLGEEQFLRTIECEAPQRKLRQLAPLIGQPVNETDHGMLAISRLMNARHGFVHPKPQEGALRPSTRMRHGDVQSARAAMDDIHTVFAMLRALSLRCVPFFMLP